MMATRELSVIGRIAVCAAAAASLAACAGLQPSPPAGQIAAPYGYARQKVGQPYQVGGIWYVPREQPDYDVTGVASWYGDQFQLRPTADGEIFDMNGVSGAHTTLPLPCIVEVTNLDNGRKLLVRVNDRGPFVGGRIIDLSHEAARELGYDRAGLAHVRVRYVGPAPLLGPEAGVRQASTSQRRAAPRLEQAAASVHWRDSATPSAAPVTFATAAPVASSPSASIAVQSLPPPAAAAPVDPWMARPAPHATQSTATPATSGYRIQAAAFSEEARARRAAAQLNGLGEAVIEPVQRGGLTLYRVMLPAPADELQAYGLRERVAQVGFTDARVVTVF